MLKTHTQTIVFMHKILYLLSFFFCLNAVYAQRTGEIQGIVKDRKTQEYLVGVTIAVEGTDLVWPDPRFALENEMLDGGVDKVPVDIGGPRTEDAEKTGADGPDPVDMPPTVLLASEGGATPTWVGGTKNDALPPAWVGGTEKDKSSSIGDTLH